MRIVCPSCAAAYQVPDERLVPGQVVRCARCETDWVPLVESEAEPVPEPAPEPEPEPELEPEPEPKPKPEPVSAPAPEPIPNPALPVADPAPTPSLAADARYVTSPRPGGWALRAAWLASLALVIAAVAGAVVARQSVMRVWPPSIRAYAAVGLTQLYPPEHPTPEHPTPEHPAP